VTISNIQYPSVLLIVILVLFGWGCEKPTEVHTSYQQDMVNFINNTQEGRELFSFDLYPNRTESFNDQYGFQAFYEIEFGKRSFIVNIGGRADMYGFESVFDAIVQINDTLYGKLNRVIGEDTVIFRHFEIAVTRFAYFLKIYTDEYAYHGWRFWGYGVDNIFLKPFGTFLPKSGGSFSAYQSGDVLDSKSTLKNKMGFYFVLKNNMVKLPRGDSLTYQSSNRDWLFAEMNDGVRRNIGLTNNGTNYTGGWKTPSGSDKFYRLITFEGPYYERIDTLMIGDELLIYTTRVRNSDVVIPFKVDI
jgi:hypothetical protein